MARAKALCFAPLIIIILLFYVIAVLLHVTDIINILYIITTIGRVILNLAFISYIHINIIYTYTYIYNIIINVRVISGLALFALFPLHGHNLS